MLIEIYGRMCCPYCVAAYNLAEQLSKKRSDLKFKFVDMVKLNISKQDLEPKVGKAVHTVPQVFIDGKAIGGYTDFQAYADSHL